MASSRQEASDSIGGYVFESGKNYYYPEEQSNPRSHWKSDLPKLILGGSCLLLIVLLLLLSVTLFSKKTVESHVLFSNVTYGARIAFSHQEAHLSSATHNSGKGGLHSSSEKGINEAISDKSKVQEHLSQTFSMRYCPQRPSRSYSIKAGSEVFFSGYTSDSQINKRLIYQWTFDDETFTPQTKRKVILTLTPLDDEVNGNYSESDIVKKRCDYTTDRSRLEEADAVIFREHDLLSPDFPERKNLSQVWIYNRLTPGEHRELLSARKNVFNLTATYDFNSHLPMLPMYWKSSSHSDRSYSKKIDTGGNVKVIVYNKDCVEESRFLEKYNEEIRALEENGVVTEWYGRCNKTPTVNFRAECLNLSSAQCYKQMALEYKFALAFEISDADYISERFFHPLDNFIIPIAIGNSSQSKYEAVAPRGSFISYCGFNTVGQLTELLKQLNTDEEKLEAFFKWKIDNQGKFKSYKKMWYTQVCSMLYKSANITTSVGDIDQYRSPKHHQ